MNNERKRVQHLMKKTLRNLTAVVLCLCILLSLTACSGKGASHINAYGYESWSVHYQTDSEGKTTFSYMDKNGKTKTMSAATVESLLTKEVASCGNITMDNRHLNIYYQQTFSDFSNEYSDYMDMMMDTSIGLDEQLGLDNAQTWQQLIVAAAIQNFHQVAALYQEAEKNGFEMSKDSQDFLDNLKANIEKSAATKYLDSADAYIEEAFGPGITFDVYYEYSMINSLALDYLNHLVTSKVYTDEELNRYYEENLEMYEKMNVQRIDKNVVDVRHILIEVPEDADEAQWDEALAEAEAILQEFKDGKATEVSFSVLAGNYSDDLASAEVGGLYESVYPGQMEEGFEEWCFDESRQTGDTGIVKTSYGYHVMYFVQEGTFIFWRTLASANMRSELDIQIREEIAEKYPAKSNSNIIILDYMTPTAPSAAS